MELKIEYLRVKDLKLYEKNTRKHEQNDVENIKKSIEKYGFNDPIGIYGKENLIVEGHGRLMAAKSLGMDKVPCVRLDHMTDEQRREYAIAHNATAELSTWDFATLGDELVDLDLSGFDFEFLEVEDSEAEKERKEREFKERMDAGEDLSEDDEYLEFLEKFEQKKTTDDCYTPPIIYDAVADYVADHYGLNKANFVRPFYPGGDYQKEKHKPTDIVVDNPPFSILSEITTYYESNNIKYFLFAPSVTTINGNHQASISVGVSVTYENGANVSTSFITNLESCLVRSDPELYRKVADANTENLKKIKKQQPKYQYPLSVVTAAQVSSFSKYGVDFKVDHGEGVFIRELEAQKPYGKGIFGSGLLISDAKKAEREKAEREKAEREKAEREKAEREKAEREKAEREKAIVWTLSEAELKIIDELNRNSK